jgi:hypothetical protein
MAVETLRMTTTISRMNIASGFSDLGPPVAAIVPKLQSMLG